MKGIKKGRRKKGLIGYLRRYDVLAGRLVEGAEGGREGIV